MKKTLALALVEVHLKRVVIRCRIAPVLGDIGIAFVGDQRGVGGALGGGQSLIGDVQVEVNLVDVRLAQQVAAQIADIRNLGENAFGQLALHTHADLFGVAVDHRRVDGGDIAVGREHTRGAAGVGEVTVLKLRKQQDGRNVHLREDHVALRTREEHAVAAADHRLAGDRVRKAEARREHVLRLEKSARSAGRNRGEQRAGAAGDAAHLGLRNAIARADQAVIEVAGAGHHGTGGGDGDGLRRVVQHGDEIGHVVGLRVPGLQPFPADAEIQAELAVHSPTVLEERAGLREAEKSHGVGAGFTVGTEVAEQRIGQELPVVLLFPLLLKVRLPVYDERPF